MRTVETNPTSSIDPQSCTLLIVDDEPANLSAATGYLAGYGFQIKIAQTGEIGLELARLVQPSLILLDVMMPGIDGFEVCRRLKADERTREIPVIFMTVSVKTEDKVRGFEAGGVDYITKPFEHEEFLARVTTHLRLRDLTRELKEAKENLEQRVVERTSELVQANVSLKKEFTERKQAEEALRRERGLVARIMETSPVSITMVNREGQITFANARAEQVLGLTRDAITGRTYNAPDWRITGYDGAPFPDEELPFRRVMATCRPVYNVHHAIEWPDGRRVLLSINGAPLLAKSGQIKNVVFTLQDITEHKQAEEALRENEQRYRLVFENSPVSIWEEDFSGVRSLFDGLKKEGVNDIEIYFAQHPETIQQCAELVRIVDVNQSTLALHGAATKEELRTGLVSTFTPESLDTFRHELVCLWRGETEMIRDAVVKTLAGELRHVTVYFSVCPGYEETLSKALVSLIDITGRKRAEIALSESEERFRSFVEKANDIIYTVSPDGVFTYVSPNWKEMLGHEISEVEGKSFEIFVHPDDLAACRAILNRIIVSREKQSGFEYRVKHKNGSWQWYTSNASVIHDADGKIIFLLAIAHNITERKQAEGEIHQLNEQLEQRVIARTAQLEAANKELEELTYSVAHDLRAPLRHIDGFIELLQQRTAPTLDAQSRHYMANIANSAKRMGILVDELLAFSWKGRYEMSEMPVDLGTLVQEVIREFAPEIQGRSIHWRIASLPTVIGDHAMLRLVLVNLLSNALKFTRGREQAEIEIGWLREQETKIVIFVRDNGVGFDMKYADKLFGIFQRLHRADEFEGTGIGLANVRRIIQRHGGRTWAEGIINQGATFYFSLPLNSPRST